MRKCAIVLFLLTGKCVSETNLSNCQIDLSHSGYVNGFFDNLQAADICSISIQFKKKIYILFQDSYKAKGVHYKSGKYISNIIRL